jgi:choline dehydrogenase-like flavoprotein
VIMDRSEYDVVIRGGGLAGFCLARQLLRRQSDLSVLVIERTPHPMPAAAHKVGEALVEMSPPTSVKSWGYGTTWRPHRSADGPALLPVWLCDAAAARTACRVGSQNLVLARTASVVRRGALAAPLQFHQAATGCTHSAGHHSINLR